MESECGLNQLTVGLNQLTVGLRQLTVRRSWELGASTSRPAMRDRAISVKVESWELTQIPPLARICNQWCSKPCLIASLSINLKMFNPIRGCWDCWQVIFYNTLRPKVLWLQAIRYCSKKFTMKKNLRR
jgi:hypothetical protein